MRALPVILLTMMIVLAIGCEGDQGPAGPSGDDGNANVVTGTISPTSAEWLWNSVYWFGTAPGTATGYFTRYVDIPVAEITPDIISAGAVLVFFEAYPSSGAWTPLPLQFVNGGQSFIYNIVYEVAEGNIRLHYFYMANDVGATLPNLQAASIPTYTFKYVVIEGNALDAMTALEVDFSDHDQVMENLVKQ